jgi:hypothetical protein
MKPRRDFGVVVNFATVNVAGGSELAQQIGKITQPVVEACDSDAVARSAGEKTERLERTACGNLERIDISVGKIDVTKDIRIPLFVARISADVQTWSPETIARSGNSTD